MKVAPIYLMIFLGGSVIGRDMAYGVEPLQGPVVGYKTVKTVYATPNATRETETRERFANLDIPIPVALGSTMPFALIRHLDSISAEVPHDYKSDDRVGLGLLHHAAEGEPEFRAEISRVGRTRYTAYTWSRALMNTGKFLPWLRLDSSDDLRSWLGLNYLSKWESSGLLIPEFAWQRNARDGTVIDLIAPRHLIIGLKGSVFGVFAGARQNLIRWSDQPVSAKGRAWILQRESLLKCDWYITDEFILNAELTRDLEKSSDTHASGMGIALQWIPHS
jgi:hypothetical protein